MNGAAKLEAEAVLVRKKLQQAAWIETHGTDGQRKRFARGLLPESEILLGMSNTVFGFLNDFNLFLKLTDDEVIKNENEEIPKLKNQKKEIPQSGRLANTNKLKPRMLQMMSTISLR